MEVGRWHARDPGHAPLPRPEPVRSLLSRAYQHSRALWRADARSPRLRSEDYHTYNKICGQVRRLSHLLSRLPPADPFRTKYEDMLLSKLYDMGILDRGAKMSDIEGSDAPVVKGFKGKEKEVEGQGKKEGKVTVGAMCRRRLAVVMVRLKMAETVKMVRPPPSRHSIPEAGSLNLRLPVERPAGRHVRRARACARRARHDHGPGLPRDAQHGGLCHLGRHLQAQAPHCGVQRRGGRFRRDGVKLPPSVDVARSHSSRRVRPAPPFPLLFLPSQYACCNATALLHPLSLYTHRDKNARTASTRKKESYIESTRRHGTTTTT